MTADYQVTAFVHANISVQETAKLFEALHRLQQRGLVSYSLEAANFPTGSPRVIRMEATDGTSRSREIAIDVMDQRDLVDLDTLQSVDAYFKRSFWPAALSNIPVELHGKMHPFGLNNPAISLRAATKLLACRLRAGRSIHSLGAEARQLFALRPFSALDRARHQKDEPVVLYQTRVWEGDDPELHVINQQRRELVRALRLRLGSRFIGGIIPTRFARDRYPNELTTLPFSMRSYSKLLRRASIGVYSEGLHRSVAFKMSEYLASGCCLVADCMEAVLPRPLEEGRHFLRYDDPETCAEQCERLLRDETLAREMRRDSWVYYCAQVEPAAQLLSVLVQAFARSQIRSRTNQYLTTT